MLNQFYFSFSHDTLHRIIHQQRSNSYLYFDNISKITLLSLSRSNSVVRTKCYTLYICLYISFVIACRTFDANVHLYTYAAVYLTHMHSFFLLLPSSLLFTSIEMRHCHSVFSFFFSPSYFFSFDR